MKGYNYDANDTSWPLNYGENNWTNAYYYYSFQMPSPYLFPGAHKDLLKQKMLEHESVYGNQVFELHRFHRVQKNLMDDIRKKEQSNDKTRYETSSSSSALPSQMTPDHAHRRNSSSFLFRNSVCGPPPEFIPSSDGSHLKGKSVQHASVPFKNCASPRNSLVSDSRPTKLRKMIDLELPPDEYFDTDEVEEFGNRMASDTVERLFPSQLGKTKYLESDSCLKRPYALADLNEPFTAEETTADPSADVLGVHKQDLLTKAPSLLEGVSWKPRQWNINTTQVSSSYYDIGNGQNWFSSALKAAEGTKDHGKTIHQTNYPEMPFRPVQKFENYQQPRIFPPHHVREDPVQAKANNDLIMYERSRSLSSLNNPGGHVASHQPSYASSSNLVNSWNLPWDKSSNYLNQKPMPVQMTPFFHSDNNLSKSSQSSAQSNGFVGPWWHMNPDRRSIPDSHCETPVQNVFYHGSSSVRCKELPPHFSNKGGRDYVSGSCNDNATSGSSNFLKVKNSFDLNSTGDLNLNVVPNGLSDESFTRQGEVKQVDPVSVLPWLRAKASTCEAASRNEVRNAVDHQSCLTSASSNVDATREKGQVMISVHTSSAQMILGVPIFQAPLPGEQEIDSGKKKLLFDINVPFEDPEEFGNTAATSEAVVVEKIECEHPNGVRNMIDLNSCLTEEEEEIPSIASLTNSSTTANSLKKPERCIIDLEAAPLDLEAEEEGSSVPDEDSLLKLARVAAEAIVTISSSAPENHIDETVIPQVEVEEDASGSGDVLCWFVNIICPFPDDVETCPDDDRDSLSNDSDYFEEMTLNLTECTVKEYFPDPPNFDILAVEETEPTRVTGQTRRTRRGRQRRDFQRDILPGLTSLARHEITEDLQIFVGLMRATGFDWHCGGRRNNSRNGSGRGRRRTVVQVHPPSPPEVTALTSHKQNMENGEIILEDRSLTGWGKTTRRPRRQRCPPSSR